MTTFLTDSTDINRFNLSAKLNPKQRSELGQFMTPATVARLMAGQFNNLSGHINLLDPGAGVGSLTAAFVERLLTNSNQVESCFITAYEVEASFIPSLQECLNHCCQALKNRGIKADYCLQNESFIGSITENNLPLFNTYTQNFTHAIMNPPYKKINSKSIEKKILSKLGIETVNLYSAFVWLSILQLSINGEIVAITPRSFCNGSYFRPFRQAFLEKMVLQNIHIFESRSLAFAEDNVLQENIIFHATKTEIKPKFIEISINSEQELDSFSEMRLVPYNQVIEKNDPEMFIHVLTNSLEDALKVQMDKFPSTLEELSLEISTGPVVDFRLKSSLRNSLDDQTVPLIYPESIKPGKVLFPPTKPKKSIAIEKNQETQKWLIPSGCYIVVKRFSAKEEKRRIVAAVSYPIDSSALGIENHLNYYHAKGKGMNLDLAKGLTAFLNSTLFDQYFRLFSGNTQVNATDLRKIKYPCKNDLIKLGTQIHESAFDQDQIDQLVHQNLSIMSEAINTIHASKRIQEALTILKEISAPKEQQNERSALCLLALADIRPETSWDQATTPKRRITEMMDWFRDFYGKQYAPNTRETVRRQTMHQFVQMGLVVENPDQPDRPINSPKWCYQLQQQALSLIQSYGSDQWEESRRNYTISVKNLLQDRTRNISTIPVSLPNGQAIYLSSGGQNNLIKDILENFCPRFTPGGLVLYVGDAGDKFIINETQKFREIGIDLDPHGKMPDVVVYYQQQDWLILIEAVTSHGPVNLKRHNELRKLFQSSNKGLVFMTAFPSRKDMTRYLAEISWETEVWVADQADHLIHFNGERFLGPYENR
ncbi:MAG: N-6 DNA methylase [Dolichospermum sp. DEX189]|jgi:adenine-specific DNA-methyltransferase|uniref:site-specific DNA-methyltransferase (adenine-specific) n=1 Tax=Aphanizomenon flos-aquae FACHB-1040 TaxID=2692887 RepID=A0ABR8C388_APHFL|nr:BsuBI/PstI family type II restriction endonuclease [Aphanizomenon flos-aquae]MBD2281235.1 Eco57I restriction-modification methylase domain-containing protein [Aphanizomenon flos-aquae FACHB-1040]MBO1068603.1 N-6 DNA methylase [Dolichospermum sp. DEX189]